MSYYSATKNSTKQQGDNSKGSNNITGTTNYLICWITTFWWVWDYLEKDRTTVSHLVLSDGSLYITDTGLSDQGDYTVTTTGTDDTVSETIRLTVINLQMPTS